MRAKTHDDQLPPETPPASKKQKTEAEKKAKGEAAQKDKSKKRSLVETASSTETQAVKKTKGGKKKQQKPRARHRNLHQIPKQASSKLRPKLPRKHQLRSVVSFATMPNPSNLVESFK